MKRRLPLALLGALLIAAAPVPVHLTPDPPRLGVPLLLTVELPDASTELAGLPPLAPFELLEPPRREGRQLRLLLLPMRPGEQTIPSLPLRQEATGQLATAGLTVTVAEAVPADAAPAPLKPLPGGGRTFTPWLAALLLPLLAALLLWRRHSHAKPSPPRLAELTGEALLTELQRRLTAAVGIPAAQQLELAQRLERLRFAPVAADEESVRRLLADFLAATGEAP